MRSATDGLEDINVKIIAIEEHWNSDEMLLFWMDRADSLSAIAKHLSVSTSVLPGSGSVIRVRYSRVLGHGYHQIPAWLPGGQPGRDRSVIGF